MSSHLDLALQCERPQKYIVYLESYERIVTDTATYASCTKT